MLLLVVVVVDHGRRRGGGGGGRRTARSARGVVRSRICRKPLPQLVVLPAQGKGFCFQVFKLLREQGVLSLDLLEIEQLGLGLVQSVLLLCGQPPEMRHETKLVALLELCSKK